MYEKEVEQLQTIVDKSRNIVFFGGAGVSTESGIPDFRSADGIYHQKYTKGASRNSCPAGKIAADCETGDRYSPEQIVSHSFFMQHTEEFYEFYREKMMVLDAKPNPAHIMLAKLEQAGKLKAIITQNIDGLHQAAGSSNVYELHGSIHRNYCMECGKFHDAQYVKDAEGVPHCECGGIIKPDVVLYEEGLDSATINGAVNAIASADTLIIGGTSLVVYPAAGFIDYFRGRSLIVINKSSTAKAVRAKLNIAAPIGAILGQIKIML